MAKNQLLWLGKDYGNLIAKDWVHLEKPFEGTWGGTEKDGQAETPWGGGLIVFPWDLLDLLCLRAGLDADPPLPVGGRDVGEPRPSP